MQGQSANRSSGAWGSGGPGSFEEEDGTDFCRTIPTEDREVMRSLVLRGREGARSAFGSSGEDADGREATFEGGRRVRIEGDEKDGRRGMKPRYQSVQEIETVTTEHKLTLEWRHLSFYVVGSPKPGEKNKGNLSKFFKRTSLFYGKLFPGQVFIIILSHASTVQGP